MLGYKILNLYPSIFHFVTTRKGGYSNGNYASFNCTAYSGDDELCVRKNRELLAASFPAGHGELVIPYQIHGIKVRIIDSAYIEATEKTRQEMLCGVDALVTDCNNLCVCVSTADCIPLLVYDVRNHAIAAIHSGWRGTVGRIVAETLHIMNKTFGSEGRDLVVGIGPGISLESFEVGDEVYEDFFKAGFPMSEISIKNTTTRKWHIDLCGANRLQLLEAGVLPIHIEESGVCTYLNHQQFFSARKLGIHSGRILSGIMLK